MRYAILDLGTNTFHLQIAEVELNGSFKRIFKERKEVKMLEHSGKTNVIQSDAYQRAMNACEDFAKKILDFKAEKIIAYGTSAMRSSINGRQLLEEIKKVHGIEARIIPGDEEAALIYKGVASSIALNKKPMLVLDIGGGSNEFVICNKHEIFWAQSFDLGAARLLENFPVSDRITSSESETLNLYFEKELQPLMEARKKYEIDTLVGCSGTFDTFTEMIQQRFVSAENLKSKKGFEFDMKHYKIVSEEILKSNHAERQCMKGLAPLRIDMIVISTLFTEFVLNRLSLKKIIFSKGALKEGMLWMIRSGLV